MTVGLRICLALACVLPRLDAQSSSEASQFTRPEEILQQGRDAIDRQDWISAERRLRQYLRVQESGGSSDAALYFLAWVLKQQAEWASADRALERLLVEYPRSRWVGDARSMRMEIAGRLNNESTLQQGLRAQDVRVKASALQALLSVDADAAFHEMGEILAPGSGADPYLISLVMSILGRSTDPRAVDTLTMVLQESKDERVRLMAIGGLGQHNSAEAIRILNRVLVQDDGRVAAAALLATSRPFTLDGLKQLVRSARSRYVRCFAALYIGSFKTPAALAELVTLFSAVDDPTLRVFVLDGVWRNGSDSARRFLGTVVASSTDPECRAAARFYLVARGGSESAAALTGWYDAATDEEVKMSLLALLSRNGDPSAEAKLEQLDGIEQSPALKQQLRAILHGGDIKVPLPLGQERLPGPPIVARPDR